MAMPAILRSPARKVMIPAGLLSTIIDNLYLFIIDRHINFTPILYHRLAIGVSALYEVRIIM